MFKFGQSNVRLKIGVPSRWFAKGRQAGRDDTLCVGRNPPTNDATWNEFFARRVREVHAIKTVTVGLQISIFF